MLDRICLVGLDEPEAKAIQERLDGMRVLAHETLPRVLVTDGHLLVESSSGAHFLPVAKVVFHGIFEDDLDFIAALALWGGPCLPNAIGMMDCRLKLPCLVRALRLTRFGFPPRGYAGPNAPFESSREHVAKWGNWHCGENKARFTGSWTSDQPCIIEDYLVGDAVRVVLICDRCWQLRLEGEGWLKSIHDPRAAFMEMDPELLADTQRIRAALGLEILANDYIVSGDGSKHLLEVNHIPNVTRFPEIREAFLDYAVRWAQEPAESSAARSRNCAPEP